MHTWPWNPKTASARLATCYPPRSHACPVPASPLESQASGKKRDASLRQLRGVRVTEGRWSVQREVWSSLKWSCEALSSSRLLDG